MSELNLAEEKRPAEMNVPIVAIFLLTCSSLASSSFIRKHFHKDAFPLNREKIIDLKAFLASQTSSVPTLKLVRFLQKAYSRTGNQGHCLQIHISTQLCCKIRFGVGAPAKEALLPPGLVYQVRTGSSAIENNYTFVMVRDIMPGNIFVGYLPFLLNMEKRKKKVLINS